MPIMPEHPMCGQRTGDGPLQRTHVLSIDGEGAVFLDMPKLANENQKRAFRDGTTDGSL
jgi:hypothetical protein